VGIGGLGLVVGGMSLGYDGGAVLVMYYVDWLGKVEWDGMGSWMFE
jgi:hypothetical protein